MRYALFFIGLLYVSAPAYAAFSRWEILQNVVGKPVKQLPAWAASWAKTGLLDITDLAVGVNLHADLAVALLGDNFGKFLHRFVQITVGDERCTEAQGQVRSVSDTCGHTEQKD